MCGPDRKGTCPDCSKAVKDTVVQCAGRCKQKRKIRMMDAVVLYFEPGMKGGKKVKIYYCQQCFLAAKSRARMVHEAQQEEVRKAEGRRLREAGKCKQGGSQ